MSIVRQLTELMGGAVRAESEPGLGTTFTIALPLERTNRSSRPFRSTPEHEPALSLGSCRVLLAEDNRVNQLVATTFLAQIGITPVIAENGREAVGLWDRQPFDVILMDVQMPVMDGPAATMAIRAAEALTGRTRTPIIALTANAMPYQITTYEQSGMDGHVSKPIEPAKLFAAIEGALSQVHAEPSSVAAG